MIRMLGAGLILLGAVTIGVRKASHFHKQINNLRQLIRALEQVRCELNYTMYSVPKVLELVGERTVGPVGRYFLCLSRNITDGLPRAEAARRALDDCGDLVLPADATFALLEFCTGLGSYDLDGEDRMSKLSCKRMSQCLETLEQEKRPFVKSYIVLAASAGIALIILMV